MASVGLGGLRGEELVFEFPELGPDCVLRIAFHRTLRIPDDGRVYNLPPSLGRFPLKSIDDVRQDRLPAHWPKRGGVVMPMWLSESAWLSFSSPSQWPFAIKVAAGKINAVDGKAWSESLSFGKGGQDFMVVPGQPWLDGFCVGKGRVAQFVSMPLGTGYTIEEQVTGKAEHGGLQIIVYPLKKEVWETRRTQIPPNRVGDWPWADGSFADMSFGSPAVYACAASASSGIFRSALSADMGLGKGGSMKQEIYESSEKPEDWDVSVKAKCFVALCNALMWQAVTGEPAPTVPPTAADYARRGLPWFTYYADAPALEGSTILENTKTVKDLGAGKGEQVLPENESFDPALAATVKIKGKTPLTGAKTVKTGVF